MSRRKYFELQKDDEEIIYVIRKHWFVLFKSFLGVMFIYLSGLTVIFILPLVDENVAHGFSYNIYVLAISLIFIFPSAYLFQVLVLYYLNVILVTNEHIVEILQERLFARIISELEFGKVQDVSSSEEGFFQSLLNFGTIEIQTAGENRNFIFHNVPNPSDYTQKIMQLEEDRKNRHRLNMKSSVRKGRLNLPNTPENDKIKEQEEAEIRYPEQA